MLGSQASTNTPDFSLFRVTIIECLKLGSLERIEIFFVVVLEAGKSKTGG